MSSFLIELVLELRRADSMYPPMRSLHEGYAVILEELDEFWEHCRKKPGDRVDDEISKELVQVAAMAWRTYRDLLSGPRRLP